MDTLDGSEWDVVILGTGVTESLTALHSGKRILHLDPHDYYGDDEAAFSLSEAESWAERHSGDTPISCFSHAAAFNAELKEDEQQPKLASSRAYSVSLAPHLVYSRSNLISIVVSAQLQHQIEFHAVGSWFVLNGASQAESLVKVPGGREDVFADSVLDLKSKRLLMKFLRFAAEYEEKTDVWEEDKDTPFTAFLERKFSLPATSLEPIMSLTMSEKAPSETTTELALARIARHARSIGMFGPGFGAVIPKWGGLGEVAQVACRGCAVWGGVYVLSKNIGSMSHREGDYPIALDLSDGESVTTKLLVSSKPPSSDGTSQEISEDSDSKASKSVSVVSSALSTLFPPTSEGGAIPAGAVIAAPASADREPPVYIFAHSSDAGECPTGQCIIYASVALPHEQGFPRLESAVASLLAGVGENPLPKVLWSMRYQQTFARSSSAPKTQDSIITLPPLSSLALDDEVLESVKSVWKRITGEEDENKFMQFEARKGNGEDD